MKKTFIVLTLSAVIAACGGNSANNDNADNTNSPSSQGPIGPEPDTSSGIQGADSGTENTSKGKDLIAQYDCLSCHREDTKLVGPAYQEVAAKYESTDKNVDYLSQKIIDGGAGVWGQVPMTPHPSLSKAHAVEMAKYILSLKK